MFATSEETQKIAETTLPGVSTNRKPRRRSNSRSRSRDAIEIGVSNARAERERETERAHTAQVRAVFEQLRAGRKAAFLSPLHRASARRREREMAKPWSGGVGVCCCEIRGGKGYTERGSLTIFPCGSRSIGERSVEMDGEKARQEQPSEMIFIDSPSAGTSPGDISHIPRRSLPSRFFGESFRKI